MWVPLGAAALLTVGFTLGLGLQRPGGPLIEVRDADALRPNALGIGAIEEVLRYIEAKYVDPVDREALVDVAIEGLLAQLDPYSTYIGPDQLAAHRARLDGTVEGIGVELALWRDTALVVEVLPGSPAAEAGLRPGDRLLTVADSALTGRGWDVAALRDFFLRLDGDTARVAVWRPGAGVMPPVALPRRTLALPTASPGIDLGNGVGYIRISQFAEGTYLQFMRELERLSVEVGISDLVIDLRGNSGGYLQEAVRLLSQFFPEPGRLLVFTEGAHAPRVDYRSTGRVTFQVDRVVVLVDGGSASASEIVAGALQDWDRGTVIGQPTFGKGLVQELFPLRGKGALHVTVSRYYTPSGRSIQRPYGDPDRSRGPLGDLTDATSPARTSDPGDTTTRERFSTAAGRPVYGGGGIVPDLPVASVAVARFDTDPALWRALRNVRVALGSGDLASVQPGVLEAAFAIFAEQEGARLSDAELDALRPDLRAALVAPPTFAQGSAAQPPASLLRDPYVARALLFLASGR